MKHFAIVAALVAGLLGSAGTAAAQNRSTQRQIRPVHSRPSIYSGTVAGNSSPYTAGVVAPGGYSPYSAGVYKPGAYSPYSAGAVGLGNGTGFQQSMTINPNGGISNPNAWNAAGLSRGLSPRGRTGR